MFQFFFLNFHRLKSLVVNTELNTYVSYDARNHIPQTTWGHVVVPNYNYDYFGHECGFHLAFAALSHYYITKY